MSDDHWDLLMQVMAVLLLVGVAFLLYSMGWHFLDINGRYD